MSYKTIIPEIEINSNGDLIWDEEAVAIKSKGFFIRIKQFSISEPVYQFWKSIDEQPEATRITKNEIMIV
jgi:hypothetical protein